PEQHGQWRSSPDPIGSPQKHAEWQEGNTKYYREWQVRHDGETRDVPTGGHWGTWGGWGAYAPVAPRVFDSEQKVIGGWEIDSEHFVGVDRSKQYRWTQTGHKTIPLPPTYTEWVIKGTTSGPEVPTPNGT